MYPTLYDMLKSLFGISIQPLAIVNTFGLLVALSFMTAFAVMTLELKRLEKEGKAKALTVSKTFEATIDWFDFIFNFGLGFLFGWKIIFMVMNFDLVRENSQALIFSGQGNIYAGIGVGLFFVFQKYLEYRKTKQLYPEKVVKDILVHPFENMGLLTMAAFVAGILGAKFFHILEDWQNFIQDPIDAIFSLSGLTYYGGLICGGLAVIYFANKKGIKPLNMLDAGAAGMMLAYGLGRMGCHLSGDGDWGINNTAAAPSWIPDFLWASKYPHNVLNENFGNTIPGCIGQYCNELAIPVFPTPLYETIMCSLLFGVLWFLRKRVSIPGVLFGIYMIMNGAERFLIEKIRVNSLYEIAGFKFTQAEMISSIIALLGVTLIIYSIRIHRKNLATSSQVILNAKIKE